MVWYGRKWNTTLSATDCLTKIIERVLVKSNPNGTKTSENEDDFAKRLVKNKKLVIDKVQDFAHHNETAKWARSSGMNHFIWFDVLLMIINYWFFHGIRYCIPMRCTVPKGEDLFALNKLEFYQVLTFYAGQNYG